MSNYFRALLCFRSFLKRCAASSMVAETRICDGTGLNARAWETWHVTKRLRMQAMFRADSAWSEHTVVLNLPNVFKSCDSGSLFCECHKHAGRNWHTKAAESAMHTWWAPNGIALQKTAPYSPYLLMLFHSTHCKQETPIQSQGTSN